MIVAQLMIDLEGKVAIVVPGLFRGGIVVEDPRGFGIWNISQDVLGNLTDTSIRNDVARKRISDESARSVRASGAKASN